MGTVRFDPPVRMPGAICIWDVKQSVHLDR